MIAILSDVHANLDALSAVYKRLRRKMGVRRYWFLGDLIGYGPSPYQTYQMIAKTIAPEIWLAGNHDWYIAPKDPSQPRGQTNTKLRGPQFIDGKQVEGPRVAAWEVDMKHQGELTDDMLRHLANLHHAVQYNDSVYVTHAVYDEGGDMFAMLEKTVRAPAEFDAVFHQPNAPWHNHPRHLPYIHIAGHSHQASFWKRPLAGGGWDAVSYQPIVYDQPYPFEAGYFYYVNPGSVGFPRHASHPRPSVAIYDESAQTITFHAFTDICYDSEKVRKSMQAYGYDHSIWSESQFFPCVLTQCDD